MRLAATKAATPAKTPPRTGAAIETAAASLPPAPAFAAAGPASAACRAARALAFLDAAWASPRALPPAA